MADDICLRQNPTYKHLFEKQTPIIRPEVHWLPPFEGLRNSKCGQYQVRKITEPLEYQLYSVRVVPFARLIRGGFKSFDEVKTWLQRSGT